MNYKNVTVPKNWCFRRNWLNITSASKECEICHYGCFKDVGFKFEEHVCNGYHDLLTMANFRCLLMSISKNEALKK